MNKLKAVPDDKCVVINLGLELKPFLECEKLKGSFRKSYGIGRGTLLVGIVGRLVPIKNHFIFLDAIRMIKDAGAGRDIKFVIIGDGEMRQILKERAKKIGMEDSVIFTGWVKDLAAVYADLDIVALTSLNEGMPVSLIEAMAAAKPVVSTDVGGVGDLVHDCKNGFLARSNDAKDISDKLAILLNDEAARLKFGACGRGSVRDKYSKERLLRDIEELYEDCLKDKTGKTKGGCEIMKNLITGGAGFIGSHLAEELLRRGRRSW